MRPARGFARSHSWLAVAALVAGACTAGSGSPAPGASEGSPAQVSSSAPLATPIPTTRSSWGTILDASPSSFPRYPGALAANGVTSDPVTQALSTTSSVASVTGWYATTLRAQGYVQASLGNPAEDGSVTAQFDGSGLRSGCRAQVTVRPQGSLTVVLVLVGAACAP